VNDVRIQMKYINDTSTAAIFVEPIHRFPSF